MVNSSNRWMSLKWLWLLVLISGEGVGLASPFPQGKEIPQPPQVKLERVPPRSPQEAFSSFDLAHGFEIELVAAEPMVRDPIAAIFDDRGRMLVIEMIDYSEEDQAKLGQVKRLSDRDGDGTMDHVEVLAQNLSWPTALAIVGSDILVAHPPKLSLIHEIGPGEFQIEERWQGLSRSNVQGMANSFRWGLDNRWHLSTSSNGGSITGGDIESPLSLQGRDLVIDSRGWKFRTEPGGGQHGMDFNAWGDKFVSSNSDHLQQIVGWNLHPDATKFSVNPPAWRRSIAKDGPQAEVYRSSPVEAWRTWRTQLRLTGQHAGLIEGGGRAAGYFTGATGVLVLDGDQLGLTSPPQVVVADVGGNLVHRKRLLDEGLQWSGVRIDEASELLRSSDIWFRPVQFCDGPDGTLYILDMYREVIEHPASLPPPIKSQLDLNSGNDRGRIWRLRRSHTPIRRTTPTLSDLATRELVELLGHANGWHRETASRLLYERHDRQAIEPLRHLCRTCPLPEGRIQALACLSGFENGFDGLDWSTLLLDSHPRVQQWVIHQLGTALRASSDPVTLVKQARPGLDNLRHAPSLGVRWELAASVAPWLPKSDKTDFLWDLVDKDWGSPELKAVIISACGSEASDFVRKIAAQTPDAISLAHQSEWVRGMLRPMSHHAGILATMEFGAASLSSPLLSPSQKAMWFTALRDELRSQWGGLNASSREKLQAWVRTFVLPNFEILLTEKGAASEKKEEKPLGVEGVKAVVGLIAVLDVEQRLELLKRGLHQTDSAVLQEASIEYLVQNDAATTQYALSQVPKLSGISQSMLLRQMSKRPETAKSLLSALEQSIIQADQIPVDVWQQLSSHQDGTIQQGLSRWRPQPKHVDWESISLSYRAAWNEPGDPELGRAVFQKHCAACHKHHHVGTEIGPGLASLQSKSNDQIALSIAEPSREVDPKYQAYQWVLDDGEVVVGLLEERQADRLFIRDARGERRILELQSIERTRTNATSLMPEGLLNQIDPTSLNHLIQFLRSRP